MSNKESDNGGFTLVEILVCITIILILSSLLMSSIVSVRKRGMEVVEESNMRQIYLGVTLYEADHSETSPAFLTEMIPYAKATKILTSPLDQWRTELPDGMWPEAPLSLTRPQVTPIKISYGYLHTVEGFETPDAYRRHRENPSRGMLASPWLGDPVGPGDSRAFPDGLPLSSICGPPMDGPILTVKMDGSLRRKPNRRFIRCASCCIEDLYF